MLRPIDDGILLRFRKMTEADEQIRMLRKLHRKANRQFSLFQHFITPVKDVQGRTKLCAVFIFILTYIPLVC